MNRIENNTKRAGVSITTINIDSHIIKTNKIVKCKNMNVPDPHTTNKNSASSHGLTGVLFFSDF